MRFSFALAVASCVVVGSHAATESVPHDALLTNWEAEANAAVSKLTTDLETTLAPLNAAYKESFDKTTALMVEVIDLRAMIVLCDSDDSMQQEKRQHQHQLDSRHILIENEAKIMKTCMDKGNEILKTFKTTRFETFKSIFDKARLDVESDRPHDIQSFNRALHAYTRDLNMHSSFTAKRLTNARSRIYEGNKSTCTFDLVAQKRISESILRANLGSNYRDIIFSARDQNKNDLLLMRQVLIDDILIYYIEEAKYKADVKFLHYLLDCLPENVRYQPFFD